MALTIPFAKKNCYASSFAVSGAVIWNDLPPQLLAITCLKSFKRELHKTLCSHYPASLWAAVFTFNPYLLISINELLISIIHLLISINKVASVIFIDINK